MNFPIEYRDRMLAEQEVMMEALQFIAQILICFVLLVAFLILIVNLVEVFRQKRLARRHDHSAVAWPARAGK
jgi:hypothetical protein